MLCDSPQVGNSAGDQLRQHAARLRLVRAARQFRQLMKQTWPEVAAAADVIRNEHSLDVKCCFGSINEEIGRLENFGNLLIDELPDEPTDNPAGEYTDNNFLENERELFLAWLDTPDGQYWRSRQPEAGR